MRTMILCVALCACATARTSPRAARTDPGVLVDPLTVPGGFMMRQRVTVTLPERELRFDAVLQKRGAELTLLGLTPFGTRAFVIQQRGLEVTFTPTLPMELPFPARYMMLDIQRVFLRALGAPPAEDGERSVTRAGETIREMWRGGRLLRRVYTRTAGGPPGEVVVDYGAGMLGRAAPRVVRYRNEWMGYSLTITTLAQQALAE